MEYDQFYKNLIERNNNGGGWAQYYYGVFEKVIKDNNFIFSLKSSFISKSIMLCLK